MEAAGKDEVTGEMIKGGGDRVVDWIWRLCNMAFESGAVPENFRSAVIVPLCKGKGERTQCKNYRGVLQLFSHVEGTERDRIAKSLCRRVCWYSFRG